MRDKLQKLQEKSEGTVTGSKIDEITALEEEKIKSGEEIKEITGNEKSKERNLELTQEQVKR